MTQTELAKKIGTTQHYVSDAERAAAAMMPISTFLKFVEAVGGMPVLDIILPSRKRQQKRR